MVLFDISTMMIIRRFLFNYIHDRWNIGFASIGDSLTPTNIRWMKHNYKDRWFADPFIIDEGRDSYQVLAEEFIRDDRKGRISKLTVCKNSFQLLKNETVLDLPTHLSFPNYMSIGGKTFVFPENGASGKTFYYSYGNELENPQLFSDLPLSDAVVFFFDGKYYLLYTVGEDCNGNVLHISVSENALFGYKFLQTVTFRDNIARRAGKVFEWNGRLISPAQICNNRYGEGVSLQEIHVKDGHLRFEEINRIYPSWPNFNKAFHTYNVWGNNVVIDGVDIGWPSVSRLYYKIR